MKALAFIAAVVTGALLITALQDFPAWADPHSPASDHVGAYYLQHAEEQTMVPNIVTAVLADYRGYDTMFETAVIFTAGIAIIMLLRVPRGQRMKEEEELGDAAVLRTDVIVKCTCRCLVPMMQLFALYVVIHGHHSPGGGFQGGVIFGASLILMALGFGLQETLQRTPEKRNLIFIHCGVLFYVLVGVVCLLLGGNFLDYSALSPILPGDERAARSHGMLLVEIGVAMTVLAVMYSMYKDLASDGRVNEGL